MRFALALAFIAALVFADALRAADAPRLPAGAQELHGSFGGQPFWARLLPPDKQFGGNRVLQLVYQPPAPEKLGGAHLVDCPFVLLDEQARVVAWNGRESLSQAVPAAPSGYRVTRELSEGQGDEARATSEERAIPGERGWDLALAPLLLALTWHADAAGAVAVVDLFGTRSKDKLSASWTGAKAEVGGAAWTVAADDAGRAKSVADAAGQPLLTIESWTTGASK
jgi:hypothetical protein